MSPQTPLRIALALVALAGPAPATAQGVPSALDAAELARSYVVIPNINYVTAGNWQGKLDVYTPRDSAAPRPAVIFIHGGGWDRGSKERSALHLLPYLAMGWVAVNVEYRTAGAALAPAAVVDCRCALRWTVGHAKQYGIDRNRVVVTGRSAGAHLALMVGLLPERSEFDSLCPGPEALRVAAIVNWFGITDVGDLREGPNRRDWAVAWLGAGPGRRELARRVSPLTYVHAGGPPVLSIHGDSDPLVPYQHAVSLHRALDAASIPNELVTVAHGKHGGFGADDLRRAYDRILGFLAAHGLGPAADAPP